MPSAQMIARAWMDDVYRAELMASGMDVPPRPDDLVDDQPVDVQQQRTTLIHARGPSADCVENNQFRRPRALPHPTRRRRSEGQSPIKSEEPTKRGRRAHRSCLHRDQDHSHE
jgi:hypothetical protein